MKDGMYSFDDIKKLSKSEQEELATIFSEGCAELKKCLLKLWENNIPTVACCGDKTVFMGKNPEGISVLFDRPAYIAIDTTYLNKGVTLKNMASKICHGTRLKYDVDNFKEHTRNVLTLHQAGLDTEKFFGKVNAMLDEFIPLENSTKKKNILDEYNLNNTITNAVVTSSNATNKFELNHDGHKYEILNFNFTYTRNSFVLFDAEVTPKKIVGYAMYDYFKKTNSLSLERLVIDEKMRGQKLGRAFLKTFPNMIKECFGQKPENMFTHPSTSNEYQTSLEDFYQQCGFKLTNTSPADFAFHPERYTGYESEFNNSIENIEKTIGQNHESEKSVELDRNNESPEL